MSLSVTLATVNPITGEMIKSDPYPSDGSDLAGFESWRHKVYGSKPLIDRKICYLTQLSDKDLWIWGNDLPKFKEEIEKVIEDLESISEELNISKEQLLSRFQNILKATKKAISENKAVWLS